MILKNLYKLASKFFIAILLFLMVSCGKTSNHIVIEGKVSGAAHKKVYLRETGHDVISAIDSAKADKQGGFELSLNTTTPKFVLLQLEGEVEPIILLVEPKEEVVVKGVAGNLSRDYTVSGSKGSQLVRDLNFRLNETIGTIDSLAKQFRESRELPRFDTIKPLIDSAYDKAIREHKRYTVNFIKENRYSLSSILALYQQYDRQTHVLSTRDDFALFQLVDSSLYPLYPNNPLVDNLHKNVKMISNQLKLYDKRQDMLDEGETIPRLAYPLVTGDTITLSEVRSRFVLIDFWALWCNDCQKNLPKLREVYHKYSHRGFQILQVSLDADAAALNQWYANDSIPWLVVADYKQWESPLLDSLSINSIPSNYLVDRNGVIRSRNIKTSDLDEVLSKLLP